MKLPRKLGQCADRLYAIRDEKKKLRDQIAAIEAEEKAIKERVINRLPKSKASGVSGMVANVSVSSKEVPHLVDPDKFRRYVVRKERWDLANKLTPSAKACADMWEEGEDVPGVDKFKVISVSVTKV